MKKKVRLDKCLATMGIGTRTEVKKYIRKGLVTVNGGIEKDASCSIDPTNDEINFQGKRINFESYQYIMLNKPSGVISATEDKKQRTVIDLLEGDFRNDLFPVGRLDKDTEGLLILTNDGQLCHNMLSPKKHVEKVYYAEIDGVVTEEDVKAFEEGVTLDTGYVTMPAKLKIISEGPMSEVEIIIKEGKFHQIKKMFVAVGKKVIYLKRLSMGPIQLDPQLEIGHYRKMSEEEIKRLKDLQGNH